MKILSWTKLLIIFFAHSCFSQNDAERALPKVSIGFNVLSLLNYYDGAELNTTFTSGISTSIGLTSGILFDKKILKGFKLRPSFEMKAVQIDRNTSLGIGLFFNYMRLMKLEDLIRISQTYLYETHYRFNSSNEYKTLGLQMHLNTFLAERISMRLGGGVGLGRKNIIREIKDYANYSILTKPPFPLKEAQVTGTIFVDITLNYSIVK